MVVFVQVALFSKSASGVRMFALLVSTMLPFMTISSKM